ncbi:MAG: DNA polymerase III subunit alpha [Candidatus Carbobacillus altaicus]|nr:DNA polymerase III subunit alpha [Candidatus Carbobacillus altaicus]
MSSFVHLHVHTEYTLLNSTVRLSRLMEMAKRMRMPAVAMTDRNNLYGAIKFYDFARAHGLKPIIGLELTHQPIFAEDHKGDPPSLILLAENIVGYRSLVALSSAVQLEGPLPLDTIFKHRDGLIVLSGGMDGEISHLLLEGRFERAVQLALKLSTVFEGERFYLEVMDHGLLEEKKVNQLLVQLAKKLHLPLVASNDVHYLTPDEALAQDVLMAIAAGTKLDDPNRPRLRTSGYHFASPEEMEERLPWSTEARVATVKLAERIQLVLPDSTPKMPRYPLDAPRLKALFEEAGFERGHLTASRGLDGEENDLELAAARDAYSALEVLVLTMARKRYGNDLPEKVSARLQHELSVIRKMGFADYFLVVWDFIAEAKARGIPVGPGRGSSAGSLVAYVLGITDVDPLKHHLLFERFLNPERLSLPDIDIDFADDRREEVIRYVFERYGADHVAHIGTFGTMGVRSSIRDIGRVLAYPLNEVDALAKRFPATPGVTIDEALKDKTLRDMIERSEKFTTLIRLARAIEGLPRHTSTHAAGIVVSAVPLTSLVPLAPTSDGTGTQTQYDMDDVARLGLVKMDFLGLRNLTLIEETVNMVARALDERLSLAAFPEDDAKTYALLARGETDGVFQLESPGMKRVLRELKPSHFEDIVAVLALYRPGPMDHIPLYISAKHGRRAVTYPHPDLAPILEPTHGVIVYQEQIMMIAATLAGYTLAEADLLRRAISKKDRKTLLEEEDRFVKGALKKGYAHEVAKNVYDLIVRFADYGFNRSHSVAYAKIAYQTAYLKAHYPLFFWTALLNSVIGQQEKIVEYIQSLTREGIRLLPPHINRSEARFTVEGRSIRTGFLAIKQVGPAAAEAIVEGRRGEPYRGVYDLILRLPTRHLTRRVLEVLVLSGAFDAFHSDRARLLAALDDWMRQAAQQKKHREQGELFAVSHADEGVLSAFSGSIEPFSEKEKRAREEEVLGFSLSPHPLATYQELLDDPSFIRTLELMEKPAGKRYLLAAEVRRIVPKKTRQNRPMASLWLGDMMGDVWVTVFPEVYETERFKLTVGSLYAFSIEVLEREGRRSLVVRRVYDLDELMQKVRLRSVAKMHPKEVRRVFIRLGAADRLLGKDRKLKEVLLAHPGDVPVILYDPDRDKTFALAAKYAVNPSLSFVRAVRRLLGDDAVVI